MDANPAVLKKSRRSPWITLLKVAVSLGIVAFLATRLELDGIRQYLSPVNAIAFAAAVAVMFAHLVFLAIRWQLILADMRSPAAFRPTLRIMAESLFFNQVIPSGLGGPAIRVWAINRAGAPLDIALNSVALERFIHIMGLVIVLAASQPFLSTLTHDDLLFWVSPALSAGIMATAILLVNLDRVLPQQWHYWGVLRLAATLGHQSRAMLASARGLSKHLVTSVATHLVFMFATVVLAWGLGVHLSWWELMILLPPVMVISLLPISINGWGVREVAMIGFLGAAGVPEEIAFVLSVEFGLAVTISRLPGGVLWLLPRIGIRNPIDTLESAEGGKKS